MKDTDARPGLPDQFPAHLRSAEPRIRAALGTLDLSEWHFAIKKDLLIGSRRWAGNVAIVTVAVIQPGYVIGHKCSLLTVLTLARCGKRSAPLTRS